MIEYIARCTSLGRRIGERNMLLTMNNRMLPTILLKYEKIDDKSSDCEVTFILGNIYLQQVRSATKVDKYVQCSTNRLHFKGMAMPSPCGAQPYHPFLEATYGAFDQY